jgi:hypothetical protein
MDSTVPADLLKLIARLDTWRANRRYARQPIPNEFRQAAAEMTERYQDRLPEPHVILCQKMDLVVRLG